MRVFVTGDTGWIGSAVVKELISSGYQVIGLTTTADGAERLRKLGAGARIGRLHDQVLLREAAAESDGVIHLAFIHGLSHMSLPTRFRLFAGAFNGAIVSSFLRILQETESGAIRALGAGLEGSKRPLVVASGVLSLPQSEISTEIDRHVSTIPNRSFSEAAAFDWIARGVRSSAVRLAPSVHGTGDHGFIAQIITAARKKGVSPYIGDGANRWPAVHVLDAAQLFRLALEKGEAGGEIPRRRRGRRALSRHRFPDRSEARNSRRRPSGRQTFRHPRHVCRPRQSGVERKDAPDLGWRPEQQDLLADMDAH